MKNISIFNYTDYRKYLQDWIDGKKQTGGKFTLRQFSELVGFKSYAHLTMLLKGQANLSGRYLEKMASALALEEKERDYFIKIVKFNQSISREKKIRCFEELTGFKKSSIYLVNANQYEFYDKWYHSAIRSLLDFYPFTNNYAALAEMLEPAILPREAKKSIQLLLKLNLIAPDSAGFLRPTQEILSSGWDMQSLAITNFVTKSMQLGTEAVDRFTQDKRNLSMVTIGISEPGYALVLNELRQCRQRILEISRQDKANTVYQLGIQLYPVSKSYAGEGVPNNE